MRKHTLLLICSLFSLSVIAQQRAITSTGREVILNDDGTWKYASEVEDASDTVSISVNATVFAKKKEATFLVKSSMADFGVYIDPKKWAFRKEGDGSAREYLFDRKGKDMYAMLISERIEIALEMFPEIALHNAQKAAPDAAITKKEYRTVNGSKVLCLQITGTTNGIRFTYFGYYISNDSGTIQLVGFTSQKLFKEYAAEIEELLNGLVPITR